MRGRASCAIVALALATLLTTACSSYRSTTRSVEVDVDADVAFRAAAATLLDDRQAFAVSDHDAGLIVAMRPARYDGRMGRTTFWLTPLGSERTFVVAQFVNFGPENDVQVDEWLDWLIGRLRSRCVAGEPEGPT